MKGVLQTLGTAWGGIVAHKLRSFLTILGIVIGVAAVISLMSIGKGAQADILSRIQSLGSNLITIRSGAAFSGGVRTAMGNIQTLTTEDAAAIAEQVGDVEMVTATFSRSLQLIAGSQNMNTQVTGVFPEYQWIRNLEVADGAFFSDYDNQRGAKVAVIGATVKATLFGDDDPVGEQMRLGGNLVRVVGVLKSKGDSPASPDNAVLIPLTAMQQMVSQQRTSRGEKVVSTIELMVTSEDKSTKVVEEITALLRTRHRLSSSQDADFQIMSMEELSQTVSQATGTMTLLLGAIAAISLLVGGIGVMNIMLVSVLERTREIGIRKAMGAREHDIWIQFLLEAASLSLAGGVIGVVIGWLVSYLVKNMGTMSTVVTADVVILAVSVSVGIGVFFGFYPAWNASRLDPIHALRYE